MSISRRNFLVAGSYGLLVGCTAGLVCEQFPRREKGLEKVLLIGVDGLRPDALPEAATPNIDALVAEGAYSFSARTGIHTVSGPGWSNILTGAWENKHGVKDNSFKGALYQQYPTLISRVEKYKPGLETVTVASLDWITNIIVTTADKKLYYPFGEEGDAKVAKAATYLLEHGNVDLMFAYFMGVDMAGHNYGFDPKIPEYLSEIETIDHYVGVLVGAIKKRSNYNKERWLIILTSDHGGKGKNHDGVGEEAMKVPLIMHGPGVQSGEIVPIPTQVDIAPTILSYLGTPLRPEWGLDGKVVGLK